ncbi:MAG: hypothetical protein WD057_16755 [Aquisalimonadaceae bacterium]
MRLKDQGFHVVRIGELSEDLKGRRVSEKAALYYLLIIIFVVGFPLVFQGAQKESEIAFIFLFDFLLFAVVIFGVVFCYWKNASGDGEDFVKRLVCLLVPAGVHALAFLLLWVLVSSALLPVLGFLVDFDLMFFTKYYISSSLLLGWICYFLYVGHFVGICAKK